MVTIDGDGSTNDSVLLMANAAAGNKPIRGNTASAQIFQEALHEVSDYLARELVRDAEGSSKVFSVRVEGAENNHDARLCARTIAGSSLVKTAIHGNDPNWGRVIAAAGRSGAEIDEHKVSFYINDVAIMENGQPIAFHKEAIIAIMQNQEIHLTIRLGIGDASATAWGCELTEEYVNFNSAYTT
jgi:glutamate N-acetyltransferase/amino-acid N-acetyltransferase